MPSKPDERGERVLVGGAGVDHDRLAELGGELELRFEEAALGVVRRVVAEVVEAGLADGDGARVARAARAARRAGRASGSSGLVRVDAERGVDAVVLLGELERLVRARERSSRR